jgi:pimeloyl-ACP methyl ester carboxylesterase
MAQPPASWRSDLNRFFRGDQGEGVQIPVAVTVFPSEQYQAPRSWAEAACPNLIYFNEVDKGGHFAAWEQPGIFAAELHAAFRSVR